MPSSSEPPPEPASPQPTPRDPAARESAPGEAAPAELDTGWALEDLDPQRPRLIETPWGTMALFRFGDEVLCCQAFCPHLDGPLFQGTLSGRTLTCPWHQWRYDLCTGRRVDAARPRRGPGCEPLLRCAVRPSARGTLVLLRPTAPL